MSQSWLQSSIIAFRGGIVTATNGVGGWTLGSRPMGSPSLTTRTTLLKTGR